MDDSENYEAWLEEIRNIDDPEDRALTARENGCVVELGQQWACAGNGINAQINRIFFEPDPDSELS